MDRPPPHPPITELGRPELKLAGQEGRSILLAMICAHSLPAGCITACSHAKALLLLSRRCPRVAGLRIDPEQISRSRMSHYTRLALIKGARLYEIRLPAQAVCIESLFLNDTLSEVVTASLLFRSVTDDTTIPVPPEQQTVVSGVPPGAWLNFPSWSKDGTKVAFTIRSAGGALRPIGVSARLRMPKSKLW
jgi:hypothetical protein